MYTGRSHPARLTTSTDKPTSYSGKVDSVCQVVKTAVEKVDADRWFSDLDLFLCIIFSVISLILSAWLNW